MCSGKTTIGDLLASKLNFTFIDVDREIETRQNMSIPEIFEKKGEAFFRVFEFEVLKDISKPNSVISTGGGLGADEKAMAFMKENGYVVFLELDFDLFKNRCKDLEDRPLLKKTFEELSTLYQKRLPTYKKAHISIDASKSPEDIAKEIIYSYEQFKRDKRTHQV